jgi:hypothetical protein
MRRRTRVLQSAAAIAATLLSAGPTWARRPIAQLCPGGRFVVLGNQQLVTGGLAAGADAIVIDGREVTIGSGCPPRAGTVKATRKGTRVRDTWATCGELHGVRLKALLAQPECTTLRGSIRARKRKAASFEARRSSCGDGILDAGGGEQCETAVPCPEGEACTYVCTCGSRSTTGGSTTTTVASSTTSVTRIVPTSTSTTSTSEPSSTTSSTESTTSTTTSTSITSTSTTVPEISALITAPQGYGSALIGVTLELAAHATGSEPLTLRWSWSGPGCSVDIPAVSRSVPPPDYTFDWDTGTLPPACSPGGGGYIELTVTDALDRTAYFTLPFALFAPSTTTTTMPSALRAAGPPPRYPWTATAG